MNTRTPPKEVYDVVIIGAGVGGLTATALLSRAGLKVCVLEKEPHVGGYLAGFRRQNFRFDTAIHWLNQCSPTGLVNRVFDMIGTDYPRARSLQRIRRFKGSNHDYLLTNQPDELKAELISKFPQDEKGINRFFKAAKKIGYSFTTLNSIFRSEENMTLVERLKNKLALLRFALPFIPFIRFSGEKGFKKGINRYFTQPEISDIFSAEADLLSCLVPIGWAYYGDYQTPPVGGGQVIPEWLAHAALHYGADLVCKAEVKKILTTGNKAEGVVAHFRGKDYQIKSQYVIAASDLGRVYNHLLPEGLIPQKEKEKLTQAEIYSSSVTVSIALNCPTESLGFGEEMVHLSLENLPKSEHYSGNPEKSSLTILAPSVKDKTLAPMNQGTLVLFMPADMNQNNFWETANKDSLERGADYKALKKEIAEKLITRVEKVLVPHLRSHILFYEVATPVTHWRYTWNEGGSMMGTKPGRHNMQNKVARYRTPVKNLFIGGHWAELGGGVPIAVKAGTNASLFILKEQRPSLYKELGRYMDGKAGIEAVSQHPDMQAYNEPWERIPTPAEKKENINPDADRSS